MNHLYCVSSLVEFSLSLFSSLVVVMMEVSQGQNVMDSRTNLPHVLLCSTCSLQNQEYTVLSPVSASGTID